MHPFQESSPSKTTHTQPTCAALKTGSPHLLSNNQGHLQLDLRNKRTPLLQTTMSHQFFANMMNSFEPFRHSSSPLHWSIFFYIIILIQV